MLSNLSKLDLGDNNPEASNDESVRAFGNCTNLRMLRLNHDQLEADISLEQLWSDGNHLAGVVPPSIGNFRGLADVQLSINNLTGRIEELIGKLNYLEFLDLQQNNFAGPIPSSIGYLSCHCYLWQRAALKVIY